MKGQDFVKNIANCEKPDLEKVRENCHRRSMSMFNNFYSRQLIGLATALVLMIGGAGAFFLLNGDNESVTTQREFDATQTDDLKKFSDSTIGKVISSAGFEFGMMYSEFFEFGAYKASPSPDYSLSEDDREYWSADNKYYTYKILSDGEVPRRYWAEINIPHSAFYGRVFSTNRIESKLKIESLGFGEVIFEKSSTAIAEEYEKIGIYFNETLLVVLNVFLNKDATNGIMFHVMHEDGFALLPEYSEYYIKKEQEKQREIDECPSGDGWPCESKHCCLNCDWHIVGVASAICPTCNNNFTAETVSGGERVTLNFTGTYQYEKVSISGEDGIPQIDMSLVKAIRYTFVLPDSFKCSCNETGLNQCVGVAWNSLRSQWGQEHFCVLQNAVYTMDFSQYTPQSQGDDWLHAHAAIWDEPGIGECIIEVLGEDDVVLIYENQINHTGITGID
jgi:hypothetical protein